jgi:antigen flippase
VSELARKLPAVTGTIAARMVILVTGLIASIITARALGPDGRGQYYAIMTLAALVSQFGNLGLSSSNTFLAAREPRLSWPLMQNGLWLCSTLGFITAACVALGGEALAQRLGVSLLLLWSVSVIGPAMLAFTFASSVLVANERFTALNSWQLLNAILALVLLAACAAAGAPIEAFIIATAAAAVITVFAVTVQLSRGETPTLRFDVVLFRRGIAFASRAYLALLIGFLIQRAAVTLLAVFRDTREIGFFSVAAQIYDVLVIVPASIGMVLFPMLIRNGSGSWDTTKQALKGTVIVMSLACLATLAVGGYVIPLVFGQDFAPAFDVLVWLLPGVLLISITTVLSQFLVADGFPGALVVLWAVGLGISVAFGVPLTRSYGAAGAAAAQSIGTAAVCVGVAVMSLRRAWSATARVSV